jgi:hypothetical protein
VFFMENLLAPYSLQGDTLSSALGPGTNLIVDDIALLVVDPTGERDQDELQRMRSRWYGGQPTRGGGHRFLGRPI